MCGPRLGPCSDPAARTSRYAARVGSASEKHRNRARNRRIHPRKNRSSQTPPRHTAGNACVALTPDGARPPENRGGNACPDAGCGEATGIPVAATHALPRAVNRSALSHVQPMSRMQAFHAMGGNACVATSSETIRTVACATTVNDADGSRNPDTRPQHKAGNPWVAPTQPRSNQPWCNPAATGIRDPRVRPGPRRGHSSCA